MEAPRTASIQAQPERARKGPWLQIGQSGTAGNRRKAGGPDHAGVSAKYATRRDRVTGDSNAKKVAEFLCAAADETAHCSRMQ